MTDALPLGQKRYRVKLYEASSSEFLRIKLVNLESTLVNRVKQVQTKSYLLTFLSFLHKIIPSCARIIGGRLIIIRI